MSPPAPSPWMPRNAISSAVVIGYPRRRLRRRPGEAAPDTTTYPAIRPAFPGQAPILPGSDLAAHAGQMGDERLARPRLAARLRAPLGEIHQPGLDQLEIAEEPVDLGRAASQQGGV